MRDAVLLNAAGAIAAHDGVAADGLPAAVSGALTRAAGAIDSGAGADLLTRWAEASTRLAG